MHENAARAGGMYEGNLRTPTAWPPDTVDEAAPISLGGAECLGNIGRLEGDVSKPRPTRGEKSRDGTPILPGCSCRLRVDLARADRIVVLEELEFEIASGDEGAAHPPHEDRLSRMCAHRVMATTCSDP